MKRFSSLPASSPRLALLAVVGVGVSVGLGLTLTASVALAGPSPANESGSKPVMVAQAKQEKPGTKTVQPSDPAPAEGGGAAPAAPVAEPAAGTEPAAAAAAEPAATPAISIGTSTAAPATDTPAESGDDGKPKPKPRAWAGTQIYVSTSMSTATVFKGQLQDSNPTVDTFVAFSPRYALSAAWQLRGRLTFNYEFTNSDSTATRNEPRFGDTLLQLFYRKIPTLPGGINMAAAVNAGLPSSPESRARTLIVAPGASVQFLKSIEHVLGGELTLLASSAYSHPLYRSTTPEIRGQAPYAFQCVGGNSCTDQLSGVFNPSDTLSYTGLVAGEWGKWSPALFYLGGSQWAYTGKEIANPVDGTPVQSAQARPTNVRQSSYFAAWLDYNANSWFTAELGYSLFRAALDEDGSRGNPFFGRYQDMRVYLGANFNLDNILKQLEGGAAEAGIVRAQNKRPIGQF